MFTGIIQEVASVTGNSSSKEITDITIRTPKGWKLKKGQSISTDGVCLTVTKLTKHEFTVQLMPETIKRSTFGLGIPKKVNLERAMSATGLFEGHIVQGHVDSRGEIVGIEESEQWRTLRISYPKERAGLLVEKGSITLDGISLTIVEVADEWFSVSLIPLTLQKTTIAAKKMGDSVNVEYDVIAKLIAKQNPYKNI